MAVLHARGEMKVGDRFVGRSIIDTEFHCRIEAEVDINVVATDAGTYVEIQGTAEGRAFQRGELDRLRPRESRTTGIVRMDGSGVTLDRIPDNINTPADLESAERRTHGL